MTRPSSNDDLRRAAAWNACPAAGMDKPAAKSALVVRCLLALAAWGYLFSVVAAWAFMRWAGDRCWVATLVLFGPRWLCLLPLAPLAPLAWFFHRRSLFPLLGAALVAIGPLGGFCLPWARFLTHGAPAIRVLTCNVKGRNHHNMRLEALIRQANPDIVALQGCWNEGPVQWPAAWHAVRRGELIVASRFPLQEIHATPADGSARAASHENLLGCIVRLPEGALRFATVHLQSPHVGIARVLDRSTGIRPSRSDRITAEIDARWKESEELSLRLAQECRPDIVVGDLNLPVDSPIYRTYWSKWWNAFSVAGWGWGGSEWPQNTAGIRFGVRIDHILSGPHWRPNQCWLGPDVQSDHLPLLADLEKSE
jgi:endonuclease/exonuclease/phosphatase (EEP) superfamily protein YafD